MGVKQTKSPSDKVEALLRSIEPLHRQVRVRRAVDGYLSDPSRNDDRGRMSAELKKVATTLRHIVGMQRWVDDTRYDLNVRRRIRDLLRHIDHNGSWLDAVRECRQARGLANKAGQGWNERKEYGPGDPTDLGMAHTSHPMNTVAKQRTGGRRGGNCLRYSGFGHHDELRLGLAEFHEIHRSGTAVAWLRVECASREISGTDIYGPSNEDADLPVEVLWELCRKLDVRGDDHELFLGNGVLSIFLDGKADPEAPMRVVHGYRFWWRRGEIVVHDSHRDRWSRFLWRRRAWRATEPSDLDDDTFMHMRRLVHPIWLVAHRARPIRARRPRRRRT